MNMLSRIALGQSLRLNTERKGDIDPYFPARESNDTADLCDLYWDPRTFNDVELKESSLRKCIYCSH